MNDVASPRRPLPYGEHCPACGARQQYEENTSCHKCGLDFMHDPELKEPEAPALPPPGTYQYKVLTQRDGFFQGKFDPAQLEAAVNHYAAEGWRMVGVAATDVASWIGSFAPRGGGAARQELVIFMERLVGEPDAS